MKNEIVLTLITVAAFDHIRLTKTINSTSSLEAGIEQLFVIPEADTTSIQMIEDHQKRVEFPVRYVHDRKQGIYSAMNIGAENARGRFIHFLNAGDTVLNPTVLMSNVQSLSEKSPTWAITGVFLPWDPSYKAYKGMEKKFRTQRSDGYISHQSIFMRNDKFTSLGGLDVRFPIAADTKLIYQLTAEESPLILDGIAFDVEEGFNVTSHNRESRLEVFKIINSVGSLSDILLSNINFLLREIRFLAKKVSKKLR